MKRLVLLRHGQSLWNFENKFTGWTDVDLSNQGNREAYGAGRLLKAEGYSFDLAFTSFPRTGETYPGFDVCKLCSFLVFRKPTEKKK